MKPLSLMKGMLDTPSPRAQTRTMERHDAPPKDDVRLTLVKRSVTRSWRYFSMASSARKLSAVIPAPRRPPEDSLISRRISADAAGMW